MDALASMKRGSREKGGVGLNAPLDDLASFMSLTKVAAILFFKLCFFQQCPCVSFYTRCSLTARRCDSCRGGGVRVGCDGTARVEV
jgi:hypothetical protein